MPIAFEFSVFLITFCAVLVQSSIGIGLALVAAPLLFLLDPRFVPGPILLTGFFLSCMMVIRDRQSLQYKRVLPAVLGRIPGSFIAAGILLLLPLAWLQVIFGATLLVAVALCVRTIKIRLTRVTLAIAGFVSGVLGTATSIGGPPIAIVYAKEHPIKARSEIAFYFLLSTPISIATLSVTGYMSSTDYQLTLQMLPGALSGFLVSQYVEPYLRGSRFKKIILSMSAASAVLLLIKGIANLS
ncbi:sulfite exporter TauE/SafE family protein [Neptunomonas sp. XY-337]|uniref:sulfite exporter TauE/SafE family protein n=1 Tax=Neptunomonas sp. XY-337 TaxID=2561897 RepID=UPI0010AA3B8E|nr:sulfite exporter TauE/SafE family protein [Neptunomonas sp. XY-337]